MIPLKHGWGSVTHVLVYSARPINSPFEEVKPPTVNLNCSQVSIIQANVGRPDESYSKLHVLVRLYFSLYSRPAFLHHPSSPPPGPGQAAAFLFHFHTLSFLHVPLTPSSWASKLLSCLRLPSLGSLLPRRCLFIIILPLPALKHRSIPYIPHHTHLGLISFSLELSCIWFPASYFLQRLQTPYGKEQELTFFSEKLKKPLARCWIFQFPKTIPVSTLKVPGSRKPLIPQANWAGWSPYQIIRRKSVIDCRNTE